MSLGILIVFKYMDFIIKNINYISNSNIKLLRLVLPIGISFYTFQGLSYIVDVYKKDAKVCRSFVDFATYVCLFPQLIAGPIVRYTTIEDELKNRTHSFDKFAYGVNRFVVGLAKKVILANNLGMIVDIMTKSNEKASCLIGWWRFSFLYRFTTIFRDIATWQSGLGGCLGLTF